MYIRSIGDCIYLLGLDYAEHELVVRPRCLKMWLVTRRPRWTGYYDGPLLAPRILLV